MPTPEARREERKKFDRHEAYVYFHIGVVLVALGIVLSKVPSTGVVAALSWDTQQMLGWCMMLGSGSAIIGMSWGSRLFLRDTEEHPMDLRYPYAFGLGGLIGVGISMWAYFVVIFLNSTVVGTLGGGLTLAFGAMSIHLSWRFFHQIVERTRMRNVLTRRAIRHRDGREEPTP
jgi:hypothetical protein